MTKEVPITGGKVALVDDEDYEALAQWTWRLDRYGYARRSVYTNGRPIDLKMHNAVLTVGDGYQVDHINRDKLDNRRANLRPCTAKQNTHNRSKHRGEKTSRYIGVYFWDNRWRARIQADGKRISIGSFKDEVEAARARDVAALRLYGEFAALNFPDEVAETGRK